MKISSIILPGLTAVLALASTSVSARQLSAQEALATARNVVPVAQSGRPSLTPDYSLEYTAEINGRSAYYIFSDHKANCFAIIGGDTRVPRLLGYSFTSSFDADNMPCNVKWWLEEYADQIDCYLATDPAEQTATRSVVSSDTRKAVAPFVMTKWNQMAPYNIMCPKVNGYSAPTGCVATAMAQAMKYYNWPPEGEGSRNGVSFARKFDWDKMLDEYDDAAGPAYNNAVASLMLCCGQSVDMQYTAWASGASPFKEQYALPTYFKYSKGCRFLYGDYYSVSDWEAIIYEEVAAKRPVIYGGQATGGGHAFICDGYSEDGYFHINWGWGGMSDGYFLLYALNPSENGVGGFEGGYNRTQTALIGLEPASEENASDAMQTAFISSGAFVYRDEYFMVLDEHGNPGSLYNALESPISLYVGVRIINAEGNHVTDIFIDEIAELNSYFGFSGFSVDLPEIADGKYRLFPVYKLENSDEVLPVPIPYGAQQYVELEIKEGKATYTNPGVPDSMKPTLVNSDIHITPYASQNISASFDFYLSNLGPGDFNDHINLVIFNSSDASVIEMEYPVMVPARTSRLVNLATIMDIEPGEYTVVIEDADHNALGAPTPFTLGTTLDPKTYSGSDLHFEITAPSYTESTHPNIVTMLSNRSQQPVTQTIVVRLLSADGKETVQTAVSSPLTIPGNYHRNFTLSGFQVAGDPGDYVLQIEDEEGNPLSAPFPISIMGEREEYGDIFLRRTGSATADVARPMGGEYADRVVIVSDEFDINGIAGDAFIFASSLKELTLPPTISRIGNATFRKADALEILHLQASVPPSISPEAMTAERFPQVVLDVPAEAANIYKRTDVWSRFDVPGWTISLPKEVSVVSGLLKDEKGAVFDPYYTSVNTPLSFELLLPAGQMFEITSTAPDGKVTVAYSSDGKITLPSLRKGVGSVEVKTVEAGSVNEISAETRGAVYDLDGRMILSDADVAALRELPSGIYIFAGKPVLVP